MNPKLACKYSICLPLTVIHVLGLWGSEVLQAWVSQQNDWDGNLWAPFLWINESGSKNPD
jgi:hypothetical protein